MLKKSKYLLFAFLLALLSITNALPSLGQTFYGDTIPLDLNEKQREAFLASLRQKIWYLQHYISQISNKSIEVDERMEMIGSAVKLFSSENNIVQVSNVKTGQVVQLPVRQYFRKLVYINAARVEITFYKGISLETLRRGTDGFYYGTALVFQETVIYGGPETTQVYKDRTVKRVNFKSKQEVNRMGDEKEQVMETFLENINVKETTAI